MTKQIAVPPRDEALERTLLGSVLLDPRVLATLLDRHEVKPHLFYNPLNRRIWETLVELWLAGVPIDPATVALRTRELANGVPAATMEYLAGVCFESPGPANVGHYAVRLRCVANRRRIYDAGHEMARWATETSDDQDALEHAQQGVMGLAQEQAPHSISTASDVVAGTYERARRLADGEPSGESPPVPTGFTDLDRLLAGGMRPGQLVTLAGRPAQGKSAAAMCIARSSGVPVIVFSLEMSNAEIGDRLMSVESGVPLSRVRTGEVYADEWPRMAEAAGAYERRSIGLDDTGAQSISAIRMRSRLVASRSALGLVIVDYLQLVVGQGERSEERVASVSRGLKALAKELSIPVLAVAQLNRELEKRDSKRPVLSDLRDSGAIEQDSDVVLFVYRDETYHPRSAKKGVAEILIAKQRNGPTGSVDLAFDAPTTAFRDLDAAPAALPARTRGFRGASRADLTVVD